MAGNKFLNLLEVLTKATEENRIRWETTAHDNGYRTLLQAGFVEVGEELSWNDELGEYAPPLYMSLPCTIPREGSLTAPILTKPFWSDCTP